MSDGCWVQLWDNVQKNWDSEEDRGPTCRFDAPDGPRSISNLDDYRQSDGDKEGDEPDALETGSRTWLVVYKDKDFKGRSAMFGPDSRVGNLAESGDVDMGGNISSLQLFDYRPSWFVESTKANPVAIEIDNGFVSAQTVNSFFRIVVAGALGEVPVIGGVVSGLVEGLWPDASNRDQVWASYQNYLNQAIAGVYWQLTYESLNNTLESLYEAAEAYVKTPDVDRTFKAENFRNLYDLVNNTESHFIDKVVPEKRYMFLVPYASLRLATLRENIAHFEFYHGSEPSDELRKQLVTTLRDSIELYTRLLKEARDRILVERSNQVFVTDSTPSSSHHVLDQYNGYTEQVDGNDSEHRRNQYVDGVLNRLALVLDLHNAIGQLWKYFDVDVAGPVKMPTLSYAMGPYGWYQNVGKFSQMAEGGSRVTEVALWTGTLVDALELSIDGVGQGRVGATGNGGHRALSLGQSDRVVTASGYQTGLINQLTLTSNTGGSVSGGEDGGVEVRRFEVQPLEGTVDTRLVGLSGYAGVGSGGDDNIKALTFHWDCELPVSREQD